MLMRHAWLAAFALSFSVALTGATAWLSVQLGAMPLDAGAALFVYALTESGGVRFVPLVLILALGTWATDRTLPRRRRRGECLAMFVVLGLVLPVLAILVERVVKPQFTVPRPSHVAMTNAGVIDDLDAFYALDKHARRELLASRAARTATDATLLGVHPMILRHWFHEAASTFPSAHAINAFTAATLFLGGAVAAPTRRRRRLAAWLLVWALAVSWSRVVLLVHRPVDVAVGAAFGAIFGSVALLPWWGWTQKR